MSINYDIFIYNLLILCHKKGEENIYNIYKYCWQKYLKSTMKNSHTFTPHCQF
jgi:hypothetical protein